MREKPSTYNLFRILLLAGFLLGVALLVQTASTYTYVYQNLVIGAAMREADNRNQSLQVVLRGVQDRATAEAATETIEELVEAWNREQTQIAWIRIVDQKNESLATVGTPKPMPDLWPRVGRPADERHNSPILERTEAGQAIVEIYGIAAAPRGFGGGFAFGNRRGGTGAGNPTNEPDTRGRGPQPQGGPGADGRGAPTSGFNQPGGFGPRNGSERGQDPFRGRGAQRGPDGGPDQFGGGPPRRGGFDGPPPPQRGGLDGPPPPQRGGLDGPPPPQRGGLDGPPPPQRGGLDGPPSPQRGRLDGSPPRGGFDDNRGRGTAAEVLQQAGASTVPPDRGGQQPRGNGNARGGNRGRPEPKPPVALEIAVPLNSVSGPFASLRRTLIVGVGTSLALMASLALIALRLPHHLRGQQIEAQLESARRVQTDLLAPPYAVSPQVDFALECIPAGEVGGDFCDVFSTDNGRVALVLGDVSGKGISAALLMGLIHGAIHSVSWTESAAAHENATRHLNELLGKKTARERFSSLFWGYFDPRESVLHYVNAGHLPPLFIRRRSESEFTDLDVRRLDTGGTVLGLLPGVTFQQGHVPIQEGDLLVVFSDGFSEAINAKEEEFGETRMLDAIRECWDKSAEEIRDTAIARVQAFLENAPPNDDQTLIVARFQRLAVRENPRASTDREGIAV